MADDPQTITAYEVRLEALGLACQLADPDEADETIVKRAARFFDFLLNGKPPQTDPDKSKPEEPDDDTDTKVVAMKPRTKR